MAFVVICSQN